jgi:hypothetical protein
MKTHHPSRCGAAMSPVRRSARATCRGHPRRRLPAALKCRRHDSRRRLWVTILWARPRVKQLALPERTSGRSGLTRRPAGRAPPSPRDPHLSKPTPPQEGRRSGRRPPASFTMAPIAPTLTPAEVAIAGEVVGLGVDVEHATGGGARCCPAAPAVIAYLGRQSPGRSRVPHRRRGPRSNPGCRGGRGVSPRASRGTCCRRRGGRPKQSSSCVGGLEASSPPSRARNTQPPSRACRAARPRNLGCAPRCEFSTLDFLS